MNDAPNLAYLAGFFDGDGSVALTAQPSGSIKVGISIVQKDPRPLYLFRDFFGVGTVGLYPRYPPYRHYTYFAYAHNAGVVLARIKPLLVVKASEAALALEALSLQARGEPVGDLLDRFEAVKRSPIKDSTVLA